MSAQRVGLDQQAGELTVTRILLVVSWIGLALMTWLAARRHTPSTPGVQSQAVRDETERLPSQSLDFTDDERLEEHFDQVYHRDEED